MLLEREPRPSNLHLQVALRFLNCSQILQSACVQCMRPVHIGTWKATETEVGNSGSCFGRMCCDITFGLSVATARFFSRPRALGGSEHKSRHD
jgi:hypothetical protein